MKIDIKLLPHQKKYLRAIEYIISPADRHLASGRSTLLAYAFIKSAYNNPGRAIRMFDHIPDQRMTDHMMMTVSNLLADVKLSKEDTGKFQLSSQYKTLVYKLVSPANINRHERF